MGNSAAGAPVSNVPGGGNTTVQFNNSGAFGGIANMTTDGTNITSMSVDAPILMLGATSGTLTWSVPATVTSHTLILPAAVGTAGQVLGINNASTGQLEWSNIAIAGVTSSLNTSSPNNTVNASRLLASGGSTNQDLVLSPKGSGAVIAQLPDNTSTGGNKRGTYAVDLQMVRSNAAHVASGSYSAAVGRSNTASGSNSFAAGYTNVASGDTSVAVGSVNTASGGYSGVVSGQQSTASGFGSWVIGGNGITSANYGQGSWGGIGDGLSKSSVMSVSGSTSDATPTNLMCDGNGGSNRMVIPDDRMWVFTMLVAGTDPANAQFAGYEVKGVISNIAGTVALVGAITKTVIAEVNAAWDVDVVADNTNNALVVVVTGEAARGIKWLATVMVAELGYV